MSSPRCNRKTLSAIASIVTPDTILRWHRQLVAATHDYSERRKRSGRAPITQEVRKLVLKFAKENPSWGYDRIEGALANIGHTISDTSVGKILKANGIEPAPDRQRKTSWNTFLKAHWDVLAAIDFTTIDVWTKSGLVTFYLLFTMDLKSRRVHFAGCTPNPDEIWMKQIARDVSSFDGFLADDKYLIMDRDTKICASFRETLVAADITCLQLPKRSPNLNGYMERFMRSIKEECLSKLIFFGEDSLRNAVREYLAHYHGERNHQGLDNQLIEFKGKVGQTKGELKQHERLGGMLRYYYRDAA
jgi:putative transposase